MPLQPDRLQPQQPPTIVTMASEAIR